MMISPTKPAWLRGRLPLILATLVFLVTALAAEALIWRLEQHRLQEERARVLNLASDHAYDFQRRLDQGLSATYALAALVRQGQGTIADFHSLATQMLPFYPEVSALGLAPRGVVQFIVPLAGNEGAIGHDMLADPERAKEARLARDSGKLTLAGPFDLVQGGMGAVARLPVFLDDEQGQPSFWGFTTVLVHFPQAFESTLLSKLSERGFDYEFWRSHPDTGEKQVIATSSSASLTAAVEHPIQVPNATWTLSLAPSKGWGDPSGLLLKGVLGLLFSLLLAWLTKLLAASKAHEAGLEALVIERTAEIRESEKRLRLLEDNLPDSYVFQYLHADVGAPRFLYLSAGVERLHGLSRADILRDAGVLHGQIDPEQMSALAAAENASLENLTDFMMELRMRRADGQWRWFKVKSRPSRKDDGNVVWDGVASDVTERKRAEEELRCSEARYRELFQSNPHPMWVYDLESLAFLAVNDAAISRYGYSREEFLAMTIRDIRPSEEVPRLLENISRVNQGVDEAGAWWHRKKDGSTILVEITSHTMEFAGRPAELVLALDITARQRAEDELHRQTAELKQRNAELERFDAAAVGRELRMIELKRQINELSRELGRAAPYDLSAFEHAAVAPGGSGEVA